MSISAESIMYDIIIITSGEMISFKVSGCSKHAEPPPSHPLSPSAIRGILRLFSRKIMKADCTSLARTVICSGAAAAVAAAGGTHTRRGALVKMADTLVTSDVTFGRREEGAWVC